MDCISEQTYTHYHALRGEMARWLVQSVQRDGPDRHAGGEDGEVAFYAAEEEVLRWRIEGEGAWQSETLNKGQWLHRSFSKRTS